MVIRRVLATDLLRLTRSTSWNRGLSSFPWSLCGGVDTWKKKSGFCGEGEDDEANMHTVMRQALETWVMRPEGPMWVWGTRQLWSVEGRWCWLRAPRPARGERVPDKTTSCCFQLWLRTVYFENLRIYSKFCHVESDLEFWRVWERIKMLLNFKEN